MMPRLLNQENMSLWLHVDMLVYAGSFPTWIPECVKTNWLNPDFTSRNGSTNCPCIGSWNKVEVQVLLNVHYFPVHP